MKVSYQFIRSKLSISRLGHLVAFACTAFGFGCIVLSLYVFSFSANNDQKVLTSSYCLSNPDERKIQVYVSGAVKRPGVYSLPAESRVETAISLAEGFTSLADAEFISKNINLAQILHDAEQLFIPSINNDGAVTVSDNTIISLNFADRETLMSLEGIGEKRATEIIEQRPYRSLEDFLEKSIISSALFEQHKKKLSL